MLNATNPSAPAMFNRIMLITYSLIVRYNWVDAVEYPDLHMSFKYLIKEETLILINLSVLDFLKKYVDMHIEPIMKLVVVANAAPSKPRFRYDMNITSNTRLLAFDITSDMNGSFKNPSARIK